MGFFAKVFAPEAQAEFQRNIAPFAATPEYALFAERASSNDENWIDTFVSAVDIGQYPNVTPTWNQFTRDYVMRTADSIRDAKRDRMLFGFIPLSPSTYEKVGEIAGDAAKIGLVAGAAYGGATALGLTGPTSATVTAAEGATAAEVTYAYGPYGGFDAAALGSESLFAMPAAVPATAAELGTEVAASSWTLKDIAQTGASVLSAGRQLLGLRGAKPADAPAPAFTAPNDLSRRSTMLPPLSVGGNSPATPTALTASVVGFIIFIIAAVILSRR